MIKRRYFAKYAVLLNSEAIKMVEYFQNPDSLITSLGDDNSGAQWEGLSPDETTKVYHTLEQNLHIITVTSDFEYDEEEGTVALWFSPALMDEVDTVDLPTGRWSHGECYDWGSEEVA